MPRLSLFGVDLAVDLGSAATVVWARDRGVVLDEPSLVAVDRRDGSVRAVGRGARPLAGRAPDLLRVVAPVRHGVVADAELAAIMLRYYVQRVHRRGLFSAPVMVLTVPASATAVERRAAREVAEAAGARAVHLIESPVAAAIGAGLPVADAAGCMVADLGAGTTQAVVISAGGVVAHRELRMGTEAMAEELRARLRADAGLEVSHETAHEVLSTLGRTGAASAPVAGRDLATGLPASRTVAEDLVRQVLEPAIARSAGLMRRVLAACPPRLAGDIAGSGAVLTGGGALLPGVAAGLARRAGVPVRVADRPADCTVAGAGRCLEDLRAFRLVLRGVSR